jgi:hypothetical protein
VLVQVAEGTDDGVGVGLGVGESVGMAVAVLLPGFDTAAAGIVGRAVRVGGGEGDGLGTGLDVGLATAGGAVESSAIAGSTPQLVRMFNNTISSRIAASAGFQPLPARC